MLTLLETREKDSNETIQEKICLALINKCLEGNTRAFEILRDTVEGKPKQANEINEFREIQIILGEELDEE